MESPEYPKPQGLTPGQMMTWEYYRKIEISMDSVPPVRTMNWDREIDCVFEQQVSVTHFMPDLKCPSDEFSDVLEEKAQRLWEDNKEFFDELEVVDEKSLLTDSMRKEAVISPLTSEKTFSLFGLLLTPRCRDKYIYPHLEMMKEDRLLKLAAIKAPRDRNLVEVGFVLRLTGVFLMAFLCIVKDDAVRTWPLLRGWFMGPGK